MNTTWLMDDRLPKRTRTAQRWSVSHWVRLTLAGLWLWACWLGAAWAQTSPAQANAALIREQQAYHIGTMAYVYGYPMVDMLKQMHNETHRVNATQQVQAPVNHFYAYDFLVTPSTAGNLRAPNNDTLYFGGWFDLTREPVVVHAPDTQGRYYTLAVTDFYSEVTHVGRRTTGTGKKYVALVGPQWKGTLPAYMHVVRVRTPHAWILGRMLVDGEPDFEQARGLVKAFWSAPLSQFRPDQPPPAPAPASVPPATAVDPLGKMEFFSYLNRYLRQHAGEPGEAALMGLFDQIGVGPSQPFAPESLDDATRQGLQRAIADGDALIHAATQRPLTDVRNGWIFPTGLGRYGQDYLTRAAVVKGGYANAAEESTYAAKMFDSHGQFLSGQKRYHLHLNAGQIPPAGAFWSVIAYDLKTAQLIENPLKRYSIGDRTPGVQRNADGSLDLWIQKDPPSSGTQNWLPVGDGPFFLIMRIYEPAPAVLDGSYRPGELLTLH